MQESKKMKSVIKARGQHHVPAFKSFMSTIQVISSFAPGLNSRISNICTRTEVHSNEKFLIEMKMNISAIVITDVPPPTRNSLFHPISRYLPCSIFPTFLAKWFQCVITFLSSSSSVELTTFSKSTSIRSAVCPGTLRIRCNKIKSVSYTHLTLPTNREV